MILVNHIVDRSTKGNELCFNRLQGSFEREGESYM